MTLLLVPIRLFAYGILTPFAEHKINDIKIGSEHTIENFKVKNTGEKEIEVKITVSIPSDDELKPGYQPLPDRSWIKIKDKTMKIKSNSWGITKVKIKVPKEKKYQKKKYQAYIVTRTINKSALVQAGLKSCFLISVKKRPGLFKRLFQWLW